MSISRRGFLGLSGTALLTAFDKASTANAFINPQKNSMDLKILATNWGYKGSVDEFCARVKQEGYDGIEMWWPGEKKGQDELFAALKKHNLAIGFLCGSGEADYNKHLGLFKDAVNAAAKQQVQRPLYINCHSGRDHFSFEQNGAFIEHTIALSRETGIRICHETHRSRIMFAAHVTKQFIRKYPDLHLTLDISHWCNVHESMLQDQQEAVDLAGNIDLNFGTVSIAGDYQLKGGSGEFNYNALYTHASRVAPKSASSSSATPRSRCWR